MVMLDARNIRTSRANQSLDHKNFGPFKIMRVVDNPAYKLKLLPSMSSIFPVFHLCLLHLDKSDPLPGQIISPPSPISFDEDIGLGEYIAEEILDSRIDKRRKDLISRKRGCLMYKIKFMGRDEWNPNPDWLVWTDTAGCQDIVADFHHKNKENPGPHPGFQTLENWKLVLDMLSCKSIMLSEFHV